MTLEIDKITKPRQEVGLPKGLGSHSAANCKWSRMDKVVATRRFITSTMCLNEQGVHWRVALRKRQGVQAHSSGHVFFGPDQCLVHVLSLEGVNNDLCVQSCFRPLCEGGRSFKERIIMREGMMPIPSEDEEQSVVVNYLRLKGIPHFHPAQSTYTKSWSQKRKNTMLGVVPGVPDLFFFVGGRAYAIEMKRRKMGVVSSHQEEWLETLNNNGVKAIIAKGADAAIEFIDECCKYDADVIPPKKSNPTPTLDVPVL